MSAVELIVTHSSQEEGYHTAWGGAHREASVWARRQRSKEKMRASLHQGFHGKATSELGEAGLGAGPCAQFRGS